LIISSERHIPDSLTAHAKQVPAKSDTGSPGTSSYPSVARCVAIIDRPLSFHPTQNEGDLSEEDADPTEEDDALESSVWGTQTQIPAVDAGILVFPPSSLPGGSATTFSVTAFIVGDSTMSTPKEKCSSSFSCPFTYSQVLPRDNIHLDARLTGQYLFSRRDPQTLPGCNSLTRTTTARLCTCAYCTAFHHLLPTIFACAFFVTFFRNCFLKPKSNVPNTTTSPPHSSP